MTRNQHITVLYSYGAPMSELMARFQMTRREIEDAVDKTVAGDTVTTWKPSRFDGWLIPFEDAKKQEEGR